MFVFSSRRAREKMIELSHSRDGGKREGMEGWVEACFMEDGFREGQEGDGTAKGGGEGKQVYGSPFPSPPSGFMDSISGEFGLIINGHSLVKIHKCMHETSRAYHK